MGDLEGTEILEAAEKFSETVDLDIAKELRPSQGLAEMMKQMVIENKYASALGVRVEKSPDDEGSGTRTSPSAGSTSAFFTVPGNNAEGTLKSVKMNCVEIYEKILASIDLSAKSAAEHGD